MFIYKRVKIAQRQFCTKVNFAQVTILYESKKQQKKNIEKTEKITKR